MERKNVKIFGRNFSENMYRQIILGLDQYSKAKSEYILSQCDMARLSVDCPGGLGLLQTPILFLRNWKKSLKYYLILDVYKEKTEKNYIQ